MSIATYNAYSHIGGVSDSVDSYPASLLNHGDRCFCMVDEALYYYMYDATSTAAENSPDIIRPDSFSEAGVWKRVQSPLSEQSVADRGNAESEITLDCGSHDTHLFTCNQANLTVILSGIEIGQTISVVVTGGSISTMVWEDTESVALQWPAGSLPVFTSGVDRITIQKIAAGTIQAAISGQSYA